MQKRVVFPNKILPLWLVAPQIAITAVFFLWPAGQAIRQSLFREDAFGLKTQFVGLDNFVAIFTDPNYINSLVVTAIFSFSVAALALSLALLFAVMADRVVRGASLYKTLLLCPYAVAPAIAGMIWLYMFNPSIGLIAHGLKTLGISWNPLLSGTDAMILVVIAASWKQISYNFLFFLAGLQSIPRSLIEAAAIDGAGPSRRFWTVIFPLLSPTGFFLLVVNIVYAFFDTFGVIHAVTSGGPGKSTEILVYKVFNDGFVSLDLGSSAAQSVILMIIVVSLTFVQFRYIERRVHY
ncbi:MAG: sn-glycerol-3-phosphate ABC transporter permease UgpA [Alphaproteobacteria bacterium]